jgi:putative membrane protein
MGKHHHTHKPFRNNYLLQGLVLWLLALWIITAIEPYNRQDWLIENLLVFLYAGLLAATYRRFTFTNLSYILFGLFISLHLVGAHYTYSETPFGFWLQEQFNFTRNHYDRIVHFFYGLLNAYPLRDIFIRAAGVNLKWSYFMAVIGILSFSCFYELLEAMVAFIVSPELGDIYLGAQGDIWDAEKDIFLALIGAILAMSILWLHNRVNKRKNIIKLASSLHNPS